MRYMQKNKLHYYILKTSRNKYLKGLTSKYQRTYSLDKAYKFKHLLDAIKFKSLVGKQGLIVLMPAQIIIEIPEVVK